MPLPLPLPRPRPADALLRLLAVLLLLPLAGCSLGGGDAGTPADKATPAPKPSPTSTPVDGALGPEFFGMHDANPVARSWPHAPVGSLRVWDSGAVWNQVETSPGVYDFHRLDAIVRTARAHHAQALIVLGQTPAFHSRHPTRVGAYGAGASSMPDLAAWTAYVRAIVKRYAAPDIAFQVWNESNVEGYWSGTYRQMAQLTAAARQVVDAVTPKPLLVSPAMATRTLGQRAGLRLFYAQRVGGVPVGDLVDVVSLQLYPEPGAGPERTSALLAEARRIIGLQGVAPDKPVWDTEINYGLQGGVPAPQARPERQEANVATTYLLNAAAGVTRVFWYSWDLHTIANTALVEKDDVTPSPAGAAFAAVSRWMVGSRVDSCSAAGGAVWACVLQTPTGTASVFWASRGTATVTTAFDARSAETLGQSPAALPVGGTTLQVGAVPVLVTTNVPQTAPTPPGT
jgi:hypothetical protein